MLLVLGFATSTASAVLDEGKTLVVPDEYNTIHAAMDVAKSGDTVFIKAGVYEEDEVTLKDGVKLVGEGMEKLIVSGKIGGRFNLRFSIWDLGFSIFELSGN